MKSDVKKVITRATPGRSLVLNKYVFVGCWYQQFFMLCWVLLVEPVSVCNPTFTYFEASLTSTVVPNINGLK